MTKNKKEKIYNRHCELKEVCDLTIPHNHTPSKSSWEEEFYKMFPKQWKTDYTEGKRNQIKQFIQSLIAKEREEVLNLLLEKMPEGKRKNYKTGRLTRFDNGFNLAISETQKVINSLKGEK